MTKPDDKSRPVADSPPPTRAAILAGTINSIAKAMEGRLSPGDVAELRRVDPRDPASLALWKVLAAYVEPNGLLPGSGPARDEAERRWAAILSSLAALGRLHQPGVRLGHAVAEAGLSELRFVRLLRATGRALLDEVRKATGFLASKGMHVDAVDLARLVLSDDRSHGESVRRQIARDYYSRTSDHNEGS